MIGSVIPVAGRNVCHRHINYFEPITMGKSVEMYCLTPPPLFFFSCSDYDLDFHDQKWVGIDVV